MNTRKIWFRNPGSPADGWSEAVEWPTDMRIPVAGELVDLPQHGQIVVESVQWFLNDESLEHNNGQPSVQLIVR